MYAIRSYYGFSSAAGYIGSENRFDHDISILIPEIWARLVPEDRDPKKLIENKSLEKLEDFEYKGQKVLASRLGYRITKNFAFRCMNRLFDEPLAVFTERMLKPELQSIVITSYSIHYTSYRRITSYNVCYTKLLRPIRKV